MSEAVICGLKEPKITTFIDGLRPSSRIKARGERKPGEPFTFLARGQQNKPKFPVRKGRDKCMNYLKFGTCKFGAQCQFDHPLKLKTGNALMLEEVEKIEREQGFIGPAAVLTQTLFLTNTITDYIDEMFDAFDTNLKSGAVCEDAFWVLEAVHELMDHMLPRLMNNAHPESSVAWKRYGYEIHYLVVNLAQLADGVALLMRRLNAADALSGLHKEDLQGPITELQACFDKVSLVRMGREDDLWATSLQIPFHSAVGVAALERAMLLYSYEQSATMHAAAADREKVRLVVEQRLREHLFGDKDEGDLRCDAFGSCANTLGTLKSDLDLIVSFEGCPEIADLESAVILELFLEALGLKEEDGDETDDDESAPKEGFFVLTEFVPNARVPVLKLLHTETRLDIDIILYRNNGMALLNTQLIRDYCGLDPRVRALEFTVKRWVSARGVGDTKNSTLSSYCWMLMMIFYLQQVDKESLLVNTEGGGGEKLLVNLQDVAKGEYALQHPPPTLLRVYEEVMSTMPSSPEGTWTAKSLDQGVKQGDLSKLLLGFFLYYGTEGSQSFGFYENIASIRLGAPVTKPYVQREKDWAAAGGVEDSSVFSTPGKQPPASSPSSVPSVTDIEKGLQDVQLDSGTPSSADLKSPGGADITPGSYANFTPPVTPVSTSLRSPTPMISLTPFKLDDTPQRRRAVLQSRTKDASVIEGARNWQVSIEDPLELQHDLGSVIRSIIGQSHIRSELRRAIVVLRCALKAPDPSYSPCWKDGERERDRLVASDESIFEVLCARSSEVPQLPFSCNMCGQEGHREKECPLFVCRKCGKQGHYARQCTEPKSARKGDRRRNDGRRGNDRRKSGGRGGRGRK
jgi:hypothetical protein